MIEKKASAPYLESTLGEPAPQRSVINTNNVVGECPSEKIRTYNSWRDSGADENIIKGGETCNHTLTEESL